MSEKNPLWDLINFLKWMFHDLLDGFRTTFRTLNDCWFDIEVEIVVLLENESTELLIGHLEKLPNMAAVCSVASETSTGVTGSDCAGSDHQSIENGKAAVERCRKNERRCGVGPGVRRSSLCSCPQHGAPMAHYWPEAPLLRAPYPQLIPEHQGNDSGWCNCQPETVAADVTFTDTRKSFNLIKKNY